MLIKLTPDWPWERDLLVGSKLRITQVAGFNRQRRRCIAPRLKAACLGWVNFHVLRRTNSSLMSDLGINHKVVADQLGHTLDVNQNVYT